MRVWGLKPSPTIAINEISHQLQERGRQVYRLGLGQSPFPVPRLVGEALQRHAFEKELPSREGLPTLRENRRGAPSADVRDQVLIGRRARRPRLQGAHVPVAARLLRRNRHPHARMGIVCTPSKDHRRQITWLETEASHGWRVTPDQLAALCKVDPRRPRLLVLNYPSNPTGGTYSADELQELAAVAKRYRVVVLSDEIYGKLHHAGRPLIHRTVLPGGDGFQRRIEQVVWRRWLAARRLRRSRVHALAARCDGCCRQRDVYFDLCSRPIRRRRGFRRRD